MKQRIIFGIMGMTGYGKTYLTRKIISQHKRYLVIDPKLDDHYDSLFPLYNLKDVANALIQKEFQFVYRSEKFTSNMATFYEPLFRMMYLVPDVLMVVDEIPFFMSPHYISPALQALFLRGSKTGVSILWNAQRPVHVHGDALSQSECVISFRQTHWNDLSRFDPQYRNRLRTLEWKKFGVIEGEWHAILPLLGKVKASPDF